eukprot:gene7661-7137_t
MAETYCKTCADEGKRCMLPRSVLKEELNGILGKVCPEDEGGCGHPVGHHDDRPMPVVVPTSLSSLPSTAPVTKAQEWAAGVPDPLEDADLLSEAAASAFHSVAPTAATTIPGRP